MGEQILWRLGWNSERHWTCGPWEQLIHQLPVVCDLSLVWVLPWSKRCISWLGVKSGASIAKVASRVKCAGNSWTDLSRERSGRCEGFVLMLSLLAIESKCTATILLLRDTWRGARIPFGRNKFKVNPSALNQNTGSLNFHTQASWWYLPKSNVFPPHDHTL